MVKANDQAKTGAVKTGVAKTAPADAAPSTSGQQVRESIKETILQKMKDDASSAVPPPKAKAEPAPRPTLAAPADDPIGPTRFVRRKVDGKTTSVFLRQMSILLGSGVPLSRCLSILLSRARSSEFREVLTHVMQDVERGEQLWVALGRFPQVFNTMVVNVMRTGEESGSLVKVTNYLSEYRDREEEMLRTVQRSITYPLFLLILAIAVVLVLITTVIPIFARQFAIAKVPLPWPTKVVVGLSETLTNFWLMGLVVAGLGYLIYRRANQRGGVKPWLDRVRLVTPIFGRILTNVYVVQFSSMMAILMRAGLPMLRTLDLIQRTMDNTLFNEAFADIKDNVERGRTLQESFARHAVFPPMVHDLIAVGEDAGTMPDVLDQIAEIYQKEVDHETAIIGTLLEPILIVGLGLVIGFIALSVFWPYVEMVKVIVP